ncbi:hypothetical protein B0H13DRAFT_2328554 [Mycena leptocephala]|nr:hypothetical protein B0H13DRAFT_2328554 [Mycena leptocephala]
MWTEQLQTLPTTYPKMVFAVTSLRAFLELDAFAPSTNTPVPQCVGAFTTVLGIAQQLWVPRLPFWLLRPTFVFDTGNIMAVVELSKPAFYIPDVPGDDAPPVVYSGNSTIDKIATIHRAAINTPWYRDPFGTTNNSSGGIPPLLPFSQAFANQIIQ